MEDQRPGQATSRDRIYRETRSFLGYVPDSNYSSVSNIVPAGSNQDLINMGLDSSSSSITMVRPAILPFTIAVSDRNNKRLQFTLLVNPESINHGKTHTMAASYTRKGYVTQYWGPNQDMLTGNGRSAAYMTPDTGLTSKAAQRTFGFQNFMALVSAYRNNGYDFLDMTDLSNLVTRVVNVVHGVEVSYDGQIFMGHFNNFTIDEVAETPFIVNYNFEFVVSTLDTAYKEIRGHFIPMPSVAGTAVYDKPRTTTEVNKQGK